MKTEEKTEIKFGRSIIQVHVVFEPRKRLSITVHPDMRVTAKAPNEHSIEKINKYLVKRAPWIFRQLNYFEIFQPIPPNRKYVSGETHYYLGRQYRLKIRKGDKAQVKLIGRFFQMELSDTKNRSKAKKLMLQWYSIHAKQLLIRQFEKYIEYFIKLGVPKPNLYFRRMRKRWGSCSKSGNIMLNIELVKAPLYCIDYIIIHELCHLVYPQHNNGFYILLKRIMPDWEKRKERLEKVVL